MTGLSVEGTLELWASSLREVKARMRPLFRQERVAASAGHFLDGLLGEERRKTGWMRAEAAGDPGPWRQQAILGRGCWDADALRDIVRDYALETLTDPEAVLVLDETGFLKQGKASCGVGRQYCGQLGKQDNCQVAVSLSIATDQASLPVAYQLYLPESWANDPDRRAKAGVPEDVIFRTKPEIALAQIRAALEDGVSRSVVLADAGYGNDTSFRTGLTKMGLTYVVGVQSSTRLWGPGMQPLPPKPRSGRGRPPSLVRRQPGHAPVSAKELAQALPEDAWYRITWREGSKVPLASRFAAVRVRPAHRDYWRSAPRAEEWFLIEWPQGEAEPTKYWLSTLPEDTDLTDLVDQAKLRWRIERDYQELKREIGLGHYEGRGWRGFHHHATLAIAAYGFLVSERSLFPPSALHPASLLKAPALPADYRPRGAPSPSRTPRQQFNRLSQD